MVAELVPDRQPGHQETSEDQPSGHGSYGPCGLGLARVRCAGDERSEESASAEGLRLSSGVVTALAG